MSAGRLLLLTGIALWGAGCSSASDTRDTAQQAIEAMGGEDQLRGVRTLVMRGGEGTRHRLGQSIRAGEADAPGTLREVVETADLAGGRAALDYRIELASGFGQHRQEVLTRVDGRLVGIERVAGRPVAVMSPSGLFSWGSQNSAALLLRRNVVTVLLSSLDAADAESVQERELDGRTYTYATARVPVEGSDGAQSSEEVALYFDPETALLAAFETTDTEPMLGDVRARYVLEDYQSVNGLQLPHRIIVHKEDQPFSDVQFASIAINDPDADAVFDVPDEAAPEVQRALAAGEHYSPVALTRVADGVHFVQAYSHNSLVVEFPSYLAVVEAPYTEAQSHTLARMLQEQFPGKPIRYAVVTHPHYDHVGGVRGLAAHGATVVTARGHESEIRPLVEAPHTNPPDALDARRRGGDAVGGIEAFDDRMVISDGEQSLELYAITGNPHVDPKVIAYVPSSRVLFQSDIFFPGTGGAAGPDAVHLLQSVRQLGLRVETNVGGHGGVAPFAELEKAAAAAGSN